ncbi:hypothetical protein [Kushneria aurantia]|uniref:Uncharacterized protein n=1 Tax=Kushneria aurantia TaxID=504092 RepID=A0ABV6G3R5_9GAMM|nr:hypothetical protein [Kushneria aurantia]
MNDSFDDESGIELPGFIALESGEGSVPVAIGWSLPDGRIKHTLIQPDESWLHDASLSFGDYAIDELSSLGASVSDVLRELETDYYGSTLYSSHPDDDAVALERLFEVVRGNPFIELSGAASLYAEREEWHLQYGELFSELGLEPGRAEHELQVMLTLHVRWLDE